MYFVISVSIYFRISHFEIRVLDIVVVQYLSRHTGQSQFIHCFRMEALKL